MYFNLNNHILNGLTYSQALSHCLSLECPSMKKNGLGITICELEFLNKSKKEKVQLGAAHK